VPDQATGQDNITPDYETRERAAGEGGGPDECDDTDEHEEWNADDPRLRAERYSRNRYFVRQLGTKLKLIGPEGEILDDQVNENGDDRTLAKGGHKNDGTQATKGSSSHVTQVTSPTASEGRMSRSSSKASIAPTGIDPFAPDQPNLQVSALVD
jgi:hypothetical protein